MNDSDPYRAPLTVLDVQLDLIAWLDSPGADVWRRQIASRLPPTVPMERVEQVAKLVR